VDGLAVSPKKLRSIKKLCDNGRHAGLIGFMATALPADNILPVQRKCGFCVGRISNPNTDSDLSVFGIA
jgi:hypothetical protein